MIDDMNNLLPPRASRREDILRIQATNRLYLSHNTEPTQLLPPAVKAIEDAEWFDFGTIDDKTDFLSDAANDAKPFIKSRLMVLPYTDTVFRARVGLRVKGLENRIHYSEVVQLLRQVAPGEPIELCSFVLTGWNYEDALLMAHLMIDETGFKVNNNVGKVPWAEQEGMVALALWLILNTKGIPRLVQEPSPKLNRARVKAGKAPLTRVTYVRPGAYRAALEATQAAEREGRASPRIHLRRAHLRHLEGGRIVPVHAAIVGGSGEVVRENYRVRGVDRGGQVPYKGHTQSSAKE